jgi:hypothetical protein
MAEMNTPWPGIKEATSTKDGYAVAENGNLINPLKFGISFISSFINGYQPCNFSPIKKFLNL